MGHLYHGYVSHNQRVYDSAVPKHFLTIRCGCHQCHPPGRGTKKVTYDCCLMLVILYYYMGMGQNPIPL